MPSIRVRRGTYSSLHDGLGDARAAGRPRSRTITEIFREQPADLPPTSEAGDPARDDQIRLSTFAPTADGAGRLSVPGTMPRPPSKVHSHIMLRNSAFSAGTKQRQSSERASSGSPSSATPQDAYGNFVLEGPSADMLMSTDPQLGRVGSALSVHSGGHDQDGHSYHSGDDDMHHHDDIVEHLDCIDPQVGTMSNLTNAANAIIFPPMTFYSYKPTIVLPNANRRPSVEDGQSSEDQLDRHVEDVLDRRQKFKRIMKGVWAFVKTPLGIVTAIYGFFIVFWGTGIVLFLVKWINLHNSITQGYWCELCQQVETGLFSLTSIGLIPWRTLDTWRMVWIWHYKRKTTKLRKKAGLPALYDEDDLPDPAFDPNYVHVLTNKEQDDLHYQQQQFMKSQTWYRPHGTETHRAFPINTAMLIVLFNDGNSIFQIGLSAVMWGLNRFTRPAATTATLLPACFLCGIASGVFIWIGGNKTKRTKEVEERLRMALALDRKAHQGARPSTDGGSSAAPATTSGNGDGDVVARDFAQSEYEKSPTIPPTEQERIQHGSVYIAENMSVPPHEALNNAPRY